MFGTVRQRVLMGPDTMNTSLFTLMTYWQYLLIHVRPHAARPTFYVEAGVNKGTTDLLRCEHYQKLPR